MTEREMAERGKMLYNNGLITREEAKEMIAPYAKKFNEASERIAKKYGMKPKFFSIAAYLR